LCDCFVLRFFLGGLELVMGGDFDVSMGWIMGVFACFFVLYLFFGFSFLWFLF